MKKLFFLLATVTSVSFANAQDLSDKDVPAMVKSAVQKNYLDAKELKWEKEKGNYEVRFELAKTDYSLLIDVSGNILETEIEIKMNALPANAQAYVSKNYLGQKIREVAKITDSRGIVTYEVEVKGKDLIFDISGKFLKELND